MQTECHSSKRKYSVLETSRSATISSWTSHKTYASDEFLFQMRDNGAIFLITNAQCPEQGLSLLGVTLVLYAFAIEIHLESDRFSGNCSKGAANSRQWPIQSESPELLKRGEMFDAPSHQTHTVQILLIRNVRPLAIQNVEAMHSSTPISNRGNVPD